MFYKLLFSLSVSSDENNIVTLVVDICQPAITWSKLTIETLEQGVKYVQS